MRLQSLLLALLVVSTVSLKAQPTPSQRHGPVFGTFSNMRYHDETGDVNGIEVTIIPQFKTAYAIFQCAEGAPTDPVFVPVSINQNQIQFTIRNGDSCDGIYTGKVTAQGMKLTVRSEMAGHEAYSAGGFLPRRISYWYR